jgi:GNAT superfamily N-acetyltransferase
MPTRATVRVRAAVDADVQALFDLANDAYHAESGVVAPGFKLTERFLVPDELRPSVAAGTVLVAEDADGAVVGLLSYDLHDDSGGVRRAHFGPFATAPRARGCGVGAALLAALRDAAAAAGAASLDADVVNHRYDLFPLYLGKLGFRVVGRGDFPAPERCSRPAHFVAIRRDV